MPEPITLEEAKAHLRAEDGEDALITAMISAARSHCEAELGVRIDSTGVTVGETVYPLEGNIRAAMLIMMGFLYECRDSDAKEIPGAVAALLNLSPLKQRMGAA